MYDFLAFFTVYFILGELTVFLVCTFAKAENEEFQVFSLALIFRILLTFGYYFYASRTSADSGGYYWFSEQGLFTWNGLLDPGTSFIQNLTGLLHPLVMPFKNHYLMLFIPYSFTAFCGSLFFYMVLKPLFKHRKYKTELYLLVFFLPNMTFWTSNLGKDSIVYFGLMLIMYSVIKGPEKVKNMALIALGGAVVYFVRPHVLLFLFAGVGIGALLDKRKFSARTAVLLIIIGVAFFSLQKKIFEAVGLQGEDDSPQGIEQLYESGVKRMNGNAKGLSESGGGANEGARTFHLAYAPIYLVEFLCSPFIWQARKPIQLVSAMENILYQYFLFFFLYHWKVFRSTKLIPYKYGLFIYGLIGSIVMGMAFTNFGLTVREKCMVLPCIVLFYAGVKAQLFFDEKKLIEQKKKAKAKLRMPAMAIRPRV